MTAHEADARTDAASDGQARNERPLWLVAHDFSSLANDAASEAARDLEAMGGSLVLLHVCPVPFVSSYDWIAVDATVNWQREAETSLIDGAVEHLHEIRAVLQRAFPRLSIDALVRDGSPSETILHTAHELKASRIIVASHEHTGLQHLLHGSVCHRIARRAPMPVLVVHKRPTSVVAAEAHL
jgi:nucleotide-binding universal stress UspA family protein